MGFQVILGATYYRIVRSSWCNGKLFAHLLSNVTLVNDYRMVSGGRGASEGVDKMVSHAAQVPTSFGRELRVCLRCALVKTYDQVYLLPSLSTNY
jgi:hypothetical protein